jgi:thioredoxin reductase
MKTDFDALIIGGGPAGLSAGLALGRMSRTALICDDGRPRNAPSAHMNNFPSRDGMHPADFRSETRKNIEKYKTIEFFNGGVVSVEKYHNTFIAKLSSGATLHIKKVILADGIKDKLPAAPGFQELWGKAVFHCPFCHGYEVRGSALGLVGNGELAMRGLPMFYSLSHDLIIFTNGKADFTPEQLEVLKKRKIQFIETKIQKLDYENEDLKAVALEDGRAIPRTALFASPILPFVTKSSFGEALGCEKTELGHYKVTERNETTVAGVFAAGDNMTMQQSVLHASAHGVTAAAALVHELTNEELRA